MLLKVLDMPWMGIFYFDAHFPDLVYILMILDVPKVTIRQLFVPEVSTGQQGQSQNRVIVGRFLRCSRML